MKLKIRLTVLVLLSSCSTQSIEATSNNKQWEYLQGSYSSTCSGSHCKYKNTEIEIVKIENGNFKVSFASIQARDSVCSFELEMNSRGELLQYAFPDGSEMTLKLYNDKIIVNSNPLVPTDVEYRFCGNYAYIDHIAIPISSRKSKLKPKLQ